MRALMVGLNEYPIAPLTGCVQDAESMARVLERNADGTRNFDVVTLTRPVDIRVDSLRAKIESLFSRPVDVALFYFAGHGAVVDGQAYLCTSDCSDEVPGYSMEELIRVADGSSNFVRSRIIILDCCYSGRAGNQRRFSQSLSNAVLSEGTTILTACRETELSEEEIGGHGVFTYLMLDALKGGAADILGRVTPASVYSHIDQSLGDWEQRPLFKSHVDSFLVLRRVEPKVSLAELLRLPDLFPDPDAPLYQLTPEHEHSDDKGLPRLDGDPRLHADFRTLQNFNRAGLLLPEGAKDMFWAAMYSKACRLTPLGMHYRRLAARGRIK